MVPVVIPVSVIETRGAILFELEKSDRVFVIFYREVDVSVCDPCTDLPGDLGQNLFLTGVFDMVDSVEA